MAHTEVRKSRVLVAAAGLLLSLLVLWARLVWLQIVCHPRFEARAPVSLTPYPKAAALLRLADHAFNYSQYGVKGFEIMAKLIDRCDAYEFIYSRLDDAIQVFDSLLICDARTMVSS